MHQGIEPDNQIIHLPNLGSSRQNTLNEHIMPKNKYHLATRCILLLQWSNKKCDLYVQKQIVWNDLLMEISSHDPRPIQLKEGDTI